MTGWNDVCGYVRSHWPVAGETDDFLAIEFAVGDGRTQMVGIRLQGGTEPRIRVETQFGWSDSADPALALRMNAALPLGAVMVDEDERLIYGYSLMLGTLNLDALDIATRTIAVYGDKLEQGQGMGDVY